MLWRPTAMTPKGLQRQMQHRGRGLHRAVVDVVEGVPFVLRRMIVSRRTLSLCFVVWRAQSGHLCVFARWLIFFVYMD